MIARLKRGAAIDPSAIAGAVKGPAPVKIAPQLATFADAAPEGDGWLHEIKFDGYRIMAHVTSGKARLLSRNGLPWTEKLPELANALPGLSVDEAILDGEICDVLENGVTSFSGLQAALSARDTGRLVYFLFDLIYLNGWRLDGCGQSDRKALLAQLLANPPDKRLIYSDHHTGQGREFFGQVKNVTGVEGIVSKKADAPYIAGRSARWLKVKAVGRDEFVVLGYTDPEGSRAGFGALVVGYHSRSPAGPLTFAGAVGTGFSDKLLKHLHQRLRALEQPDPNAPLPKGFRHGTVHWVRPELVAEVKFTEWTRDGILRHPAFLGLREDKRAGEVVLDREMSAGATVSRWAKMRRGAKR